MDSTALRYTSTILSFCALVFGIVGVSTMDWFVVQHDISGITRYSHFSITGRVEQDSVSLTTGATVSVILNAWDGTASCSGTCDFTTLTAQTCSSLRSVTGTTVFNDWYYGSLCPYGQTTLAFVIFALFTNLVGLLLLGLSSVNFLNPMVGGILNILAFIGYFVASAVYGGGVGAKARDGWWGTNAQAMMGFSYILNVVAMGVAVAAGGIALAAKPNNGTQQPTMRAGTPKPMDYIAHSSPGVYSPAYRVESGPATYLVGQPSVAATSTPPTMTYSTQYVPNISSTHQVSPTSSPRRVVLPAPLDRADALMSRQLQPPFPSQSYYRDVIHDYA